MNIIALFELISLDKSKITTFTRQDFTVIKKQLLAEKENNSAIEDIHISNLLEALKKHSDSFDVILNNRVLFNFFAKKDYSRNQFSNQFDTIDKEKVKSFVQEFFGEELSLFFNQNLEINAFDKIGNLAEAQDYFPATLNFTLKQISLDKLDDTIAVLKPPYGNFSKIQFIKDPYFFVFLNQIKDQEIEDKIEKLLQLITAIYKQDTTSELANKTFLAMSSYKALDNDFTQILKRNKDIGESNFEAYKPKKKNRLWIYIFIGVFVFIRIVFFLNTYSFNKYSNDDDQNYNNETPYKPEPRKIDRYYTNMRFAIDSFRVFLTEYKPSEIKQLTPNKSLKTGENPFETFYENPPTGDSNHYITVTNNTNYDMVLLENTVLYDTIKVPRSAHYIKAGDNLEINFKSDYTKTIFNVYIGKKWATFQTNSKHLFIRNHSIVEYRFSELVPTAKEILRTDYGFLNDAIISYSKGELSIDSPGARVNSLYRDKK
jgi:hypothetical protein